MLETDGWDNANVCFSFLNTGEQLDDEHVIVKCKDGTKPVCCYTVVCFFLFPLDLFLGSILECGLELG